MLLLISCITFLGLIKLIFLNKKNSRKLFVIISGLSLFLISALRSIYFTTDVQLYVNKYISISYINLYELWINFITNTGKDPFFYVFSKVISLLGASYRVWLAIIAGFFCYSISKFIYKYSEEAYISVIALVSLGYFYFSLSGLRQTLALSIILFSYKYLIERRLIPFIIVIIFGSLFHFSAIVFLIAYPLSRMKIGWKQVVGVLAALVAAYLFRPQIIGLLSNLNMNDQYTYYLEHGTTLTISGFLIQLFIYLFCLYFKNDILKCDNKNLTLYNLLFLGLVFQAFATVIAEFFRISMYFSIFSIVLIPKAIVAEKDKYLRVIIYFVVLAALILYIMRTGSFSGFKFFWSY